MNKTKEQSRRFARMVKVGDEDYNLTLFPHELKQLKVTDGDYLWLETSEDKLIIRRATKAEIASGT